MVDLSKTRASGKKWLLRLVIGAVLLGGIGFALDVLLTLHVSYSEGERVGYVQKLSKRGWICKTNEGELAMVNVAGQPATIFTFTVADDKVARDIEAQAGKRVELQYEEHRGVPSSCFGDTQYFVVGVKKAE